MKVTATNIEFTRLVDNGIDEIEMPEFVVTFQIGSHNQTVELRFTVDTVKTMGDALSEARKQLAEFADELKFEAQAGAMGHRRLG
ncbi:hypothetical protein [Camelimonas lactis]|uniref:Uncharacterized protein n=1 Tax=Camelimonas lactis TaxID=659006 RepID=A0A4V2RXQ9_9HYPH|nr:hypothetical protein [Camelimonas lactis]TCO15227.1 hypothetical protein EV666_102205 [Camelimonas lactis]